MMNEKNKVLAHNAIDSVAASYHKSERDGDLFVEARFNKLCASFESVLASVRKEAREGALREVIGKVTTLPTRGTINYRRGYEEGVRDALRTIEAAANTANNEEGGGDGEVSKEAKSNRS